MNTPQILKTTAATAATIASGAALFFAGAGTAFAPDPGRLNSNSPLAATTNAWAYATYIDSQQPTYGFYTSNTWKTGYYYQSYAGYPCSRYRQPAGTTLPGFIMVSGNLSRCSDY
jgi:hypothetical protein